MRYLLVLLLAACAAPVVDVEKLELDNCDPARQCLGICCADEDFVISCNPTDDSGRGLVVPGCFPFCRVPDGWLPCPRELR